jgi:hypothetical protein
VGKGRRLAQRVRRGRGREPGEEALPEKPPVGEADRTGGAPQAAPAEPAEDDAAARIDAARARLRATIDPPADPDG